MGGVSARKILGLVPDLQWVKPSLGALPAPQQAELDPGVLRLLELVLTLLWVRSFPGTADYRVQLYGLKGFKSEAGASLLVVEAKSWDGWLRIQGVSKLVLA